MSDGMLYTATLSQPLACFLEWLVMEVGNVLRQIKCSLLGYFHTHTLIQPIARLPLKNEREKLS